MQSILGLETNLWLAEDKLSNSMDAAEYKHVVLGLIFLKYISDTFDMHRVKLVEGKGDYEGANPEDQDEYNAVNVFWVPLTDCIQLVGVASKSKDVLGRSSSISTHNSLVRRVKTAASSIPTPATSDCSSKYSPPTKAGYTIPPAARA